MRRILIILIVLFVSIAFLACNTNQQNATSIGTSYCNDTCMNKFCKRYNVNDLPGRVGADIIDSMSRDYNSKLVNSGFRINCNSATVDPRNTTAKSGGVVNNTTSVVFSVEQLKNLIYQMESALCKYNCPATELGIRFYFVKYPCDLGPDRRKGDGLDDLPYGVRGMNSLVMVPTFKSKNASNLWMWIDYSLWEAAINNCFPKIGLRGRDDLVYKIGSIPDPGENHGGIAPPPFPGTFPTNEEE